MFRNCTKEAGTTEKWSQGPVNVLPCPCNVGHPSSLHSTQISSCATTLSESGHIPYTFVVYQEYPSLIIYSSIPKLKIDQEQLQYIQHSNNPPFLTPFPTLAFAFYRINSFFNLQCLDWLYCSCCCLNYYCNLLWRFFKTPKKLTHSPSLND